MKLKSFILASIIGLGFSACSNDDVVTEGTDPTANGNTYVSVSINLAQSLQKSLPEDYNPDGTYEGLDGITNLDLYMVSGDGTIEAKRFAATDLSVAGNVLTLDEPFRTTSGSKSIFVVVNNPNPIGTTVPKDDDLLDIAGLARTADDGSGTLWDVITMTGKNTSVVIAPDITQQAASMGANNFSVNVTRLASRAIVTTTASTDLLAQDGTKLGTISNITYSVAQGAKKIYVTGKSDFTTFGSEYITALGDYTTQAVNYYDYSDLNTPSAVPAMPTSGDYKSMKGKFLFENTHIFGDVKSTGYRQGNTAYILVKATLTPLSTAIADGGTLTNGTFYVGASDGKIYSSKEAAQNAVENQKVSLFQNGKMIYYAWLNPDNIATPLNSPVLRNNIYHVNITGFSKIGLTWNPLYPEDPDNPNPQNPDPKPDNPDEPTNPINPIDPLTPEQTYMSVDISVLEWTVHSYDIEL